MQPAPVVHTDLWTHSLLPQCSLSITCALRFVTPYVIYACTHSNLTLDIVSCLFRSAINTVFTFYYLHTEILYLVYSDKSCTLATFPGSHQVHSSNFQLGTFADPKSAISNFVQPPPHSTYHSWHPSGVNQMSVGHFTLMDLRTP